MPPILPLSTEEMNTLFIAMHDVQEFMTREASAVANEAIDAWIINTVLLSKPVYSMRPDAIVEVTDSIFRDEIISDFVTELAFRVFSTWSVGEHTYKRVCASLACGLEIDTNESDLCVIPHGIRGSMPVTVFSSLEQEGKAYGLTSSKKKISAFDFLCDNRHMVVFFLIYLTNKRN